MSLIIIWNTRFPRTLICLGLIYGESIILFKISADFCFFFEIWDLRARQMSAGPGGGGRRLMVSILEFEVWLGLRNGSIELKLDLWFVSFLFQNVEMEISVLVTSITEEILNSKSTPSPTLTMIYCRWSYLNHWECQIFS